MKTQAYKTGGPIHEYKNLLLKTGEPYSTIAYFDTFGDVTDTLRAMSRVYYFVSAEFTVEVDGTPKSAFVTWLDDGADTPVAVRLDEEDWRQSADEDKDEKLSGPVTISIWPNPGV